MDSNDVINLIPLDNSTEDLAKEIVEEKNFDRTQQLINLFNLNQAKKNALRVLKLNQLLDKVSDQMIERFDKRPGEFSNADLLNYMTVVQSSIDRANKSLNQIDDMPTINLNQVNVNIQKDDIDVLDRESRERVNDAIKAIMSKINNEKNKTEPEVVPIIVEDEKVSEGLLNEEN